MSRLLRKAGTPSVAGVQRLGCPQIKTAGVERLRCPDQEEATNLRKIPARFEIKVTVRAGMK
jgi:hypothetical protein